MDSLSTIFAPIADHVAAQAIQDARHAVREAGAGVVQIFVSPTGVYHFGESSRLARTCASAPLTAKTTTDAKTLCESIQAGFRNAGNSW